MPQPAPIAALVTLLLTASTLGAQTRPTTAPTSRPATYPPITEFRPTEPWPDDGGHHIQAHGGGIIKVDDTYYWFGEYRAVDFPRTHRAVGCYASTDLLHWTFKGLPLEVSATDFPVLERPKVFHNKKTGKFVMYVHADSANYKRAEVATFTADKPEGPYTFVRSFRPLGQESRDIGQFVDDDGTAYLIFEDRPNGFHIARLSDDYLDVVEDTCLIKAHLEGGAVINYKGLYYAIGSALTGWNANPNKYATATSLKGPWSEWRDIAPPETKTYGSQSSFILKIVGSRSTAAIFVGDIWKPRTQWDSRYLWMPLEIGDGKLRLPAPAHWKLDLATGETTLLK